MGDGEDGPTHQPVEHLASLRAIPGLITLRPGDANEVVEAYRYIMQLRHKPAVLALTRQALPTLDRTKYAPASGVAHGAYVLADPPGGDPEVILMATGSELILAVEAHEQLTAEGIRSRVVSMPSWEIFEHETLEYRAGSARARIDTPFHRTQTWARKERGIICIRVHHRCHHDAGRPTHVERLLTAGWPRLRRHVTGRLPGDAGRQWALTCRIKVGGLA